MLNMRQTIFKRFKQNYIFITALFLFIVSMHDSEVNYLDLDMNNFGSISNVNNLYWLSLMIPIIIIFISGDNYKTLFISLLMLILIMYGGMSYLKPLGTLHDSLFNLLRAYDYLEIGHVNIHEGPLQGFPGAEFIWGFLRVITNINFNYMLKYHSLYTAIYYSISLFLLSFYFYRGDLIKSYYVVTFALIFGVRFNMRLNASPQTVGIIMSIFILSYILKSSDNVIISLISCIALTITHPLTCYYTILIIISLFFANMLNKKLYDHKLISGFIRSGNIFNNLLNFSFILFIWFIYNGIIPFRIGVYALYDILFNIIMGLGFEYEGVSQLYYLSDPPLKMYLSNRVGWILLIYLFICFFIGGYKMTKRRDGKLSYIIFWSGVISVNFIFFSIIKSIYFDSIMDRAFSFMLIPFSLMLSYLITDLKKDLLTKSIFIKKILSFMFVIMAISNIYVGYYTDNYDMITPTEVSGYYYGVNYGSNIPFYKNYVQNIDETVYVSTQSINYRTYRESTLNNTLQLLMNKVNDSSDHNNVYCNGNIFYYDYKESLT